MILAIIGRPNNREIHHNWWRWQIERQRNRIVTLTGFCRQLGVSVPYLESWKRRFALASCAILSFTIFGSCRRTVARNTGETIAVANEVSPAIAGVDEPIPTVDPGQEHQQRMGSSDWGGREDDGS